MEKIDRAMLEFKQMDEMAAGNSFLHRIHPGIKLLVTITYIAVTVSFDKYDFSGLILMVLYPVLLFQMSDTDFKTCLYKLRIVLPLVLAVGLFNPFLDKRALMRIGGVVITGGMVSMLTLMMKGIFALSASFLLAATTRMDDLCACLRKIRIPDILVTMLLLTYRYISLMMEEVSTMTTAYSLRAPGQKGVHVSAWGSFLGQLLLRSMDRAQELYESMLLRGFHGEYAYAESRKADRGSLVFLVCWILFFVIARTLHPVAALGNLFV